MPRDEDYVKDMLDAARLVVDLTVAVDEAVFNTEIMRHWTVIKQIEIIGEAAIKVSDEFRHKYPDILWHEIIGMRHRLVHDYRNIKLPIVWETATQTVPALIKQLEPLIPPEE